MRVKIFPIFHPALQRRKQKATFRSWSFSLTKQMFVNSSTGAGSEASLFFFGSFAHPLAIFVYKILPISDSISAELTGQSKQHIFVVFPAPSLRCSRPTHPSKLSNYLRITAQKLVLISCRVARTYVSVSDRRVSYGFLMRLTIGLILKCA